MKRAIVLYVVGMCVAMCIALATDIYLVRIADLSLRKLTYTCTEIVVEGGNHA